MSRRSEAGKAHVAWAHGPSAVHVAMTNTLNTPVEALELAYPLRVERYALRLGSGGDGRLPGRRWDHPRDPSARGMPRFRHRRATEHGPTGGSWWAAWSRRAERLLNGEEQPAKFTRQLRAGDLLTIETPGGGGYGEPAA